MFVEFRRLLSDNESIIITYEFMNRRIGIFYAMAGL